VIDDKNLPREVRKDRQIARALHKSDDVSVIKLTDKIGNLLAIANGPRPCSGIGNWPMCRMGEGRHIGLLLEPARLMARFEEAARLAAESIEQRV
jgi:hypothetical protein